MLEKILSLSTIYYKELIIIILVAVSVLTMDKSVAEGQNFGIKTSSVKNFLNANKVKVPFGFNFNRDVADSLEKSTLYVYCY